MQLNPRWAELLRSAGTQPGTLNKAYSLFWNYSTGNQILALEQCRRRSIEPGPLATYRKWQELGRQVRKGEKALSLWMPLTIKRRQKPEEESAKDLDANSIEFATAFVVKNYWFVLSQTEGKEFSSPIPPTWNVDRAMGELNIRMAPFSMTDGNCQGYAVGREIAINPIAALPEKTTFHEIAHILLGHTGTEMMADLPTLSRNQKEMEAESVALICIESLGLPGSADARGYIQHWYGQGAEIPEANARRIFQAADRILKSGSPSKGGDE